MWFCRSCLSKSPLFVSTPVKTSYCIPRTFKTLSCLSREIPKKWIASESFQLFNKPNIKLFEVPLKKAVTYSKIDTAIQRKQVGTWLLLCCGIVYMVVTVGGYTRLTESGLSMVKWKFAYEKFPSSEEEWLAEFQKYQEYPEYKLLKRDLTLSEFKRIWWTEYIHRNMGRLFGIAFLIPALSFWIKGYFLPPMKKRILIFGSLIVAQGFLGWYMVKSGLEDRFQGESDVPRVSQYRLAAHLTLALVLYTSLLWTALDLVIPAQAVDKITAGARRIRMMAHSSKGLAFLTAISGAFVSGLDAGLIYGTFPKMGDKWIPDDILALSPLYKNFTENPTTVQFQHKVLGIATFSLIMATWFLSRRQLIPSRARVAANLLAVAACVQVMLGISTLVHNVPLSLAVSHQSGSIILLTTAIWLSHELKKLKYIPK